VSPTIGDLNAEHHRHREYDRSRHNWDIPIKNSQNSSQRPIPGR
jgi:hypothetical protein